MKKYISGFIVGVLTTVGITVFAEEVKSFIAEKATFDVYVAGEKFESDKPAVVIDGSTYLPLRATGEALGVNVEWNAEKRRVEVGEMKATISEATPASTKIPTNIPVTTPVPMPPSQTKGAAQNWYNFRSDIIPNADGFPMITKDGEHYLLLSLFGQDNIIYPETKDGFYSVKLPGTEPVQLSENNTVKYEGRTFVKVSSLGLKARIEGDTAYIEWAD